MLTALFIGKRPRAEIFEPISMVRDVRPMNKPSGGLWTCPDNARGRSAWRAWCQSERTNFARYKRTWRVFAEAPRVYTIDGVQDLREAIRRWPHQRYQDISSLSDVYEIDFGAMASNFDAVYLTAEGQWRTRFSFPENLYGWDMPSILWLRWMFTHVESVRR